jgi:hypothetical protein
VGRGSRREKNILKKQCEVKIFLLMVKKEKKQKQM